MQHNQDHIMTTDHQAQGKSDHVRDGAEAHSNLNTWHAVIAILEGGLLYGGRTDKPSHRIIAIAKAESLKELALYDKHRNAAAWTTS